MDEPGCGDCRFFEKTEPGRELGECRRRAPAPLVILRTGRVVTHDAYWPHVATDEWCGEYEPKPEGK